MLRGAVDLLSAERVVGWLYGEALQAAPRMRAILEDQVIGEAVANQYRPDLEKVGFGDGRCGFEIRFARKLEAGQMAFLNVRPAGWHLNLPLGEHVPYVDVVRGAMGDFPGAGRSRSVLGGLWTDRTDGAICLARRLSAGSLPAQLAPLLASMIEDGHVVCADVLPPPGLTQLHIAQAEACAPPQGGTARTARQEAAMQPAMAALASLLFQDQVAGLLRAMLEGDPVLYRLDMLRETGGLTQAVAFESLPSPAECVALYVAGPQAGARLEHVRGSHELPEFTRHGLSRWSPAGAAAGTALAAQAGFSLQDAALRPTDVTIVGPGLIHRVVTGESAPVLRALLAPMHLTPLRFLAGESPWLEHLHTSGAKLRL